MEASNISDIMEQLFGGPVAADNLLFAYCITRHEVMLVTDSESGDSTGRARGQVVLVPVVCGQCERVYGGLGEGAGRMEISDNILRGSPVFGKVEEWCGARPEVVRQIQRAEAIVRAGQNYTVGMRTVVNLVGRPFEVASHLNASFM